MFFCVQLISDLYQEAIIKRIIVPKFWLIDAHFPYLVLLGSWHAKRVGPNNLRNEYLWGWMCAVSFRFFGLSLKVSTLHWTLVYFLLLKNAYHLELLFFKNENTKRSTISSFSGVNWFLWNSKCTFLPF